MTDSVNWTCPTCNVAVITHFCAHCGEERLAPRDLTLRGLGEKLLHALTSTAPGNSGISSSPSAREGSTPPGCCSSRHWP